MDNNKLEVIIMYQPKVTITVSDETVKCLLEAFDKLIILSNNLEGIIRYFIKKEPEQHITIPFSIEEIYEPECDCDFSLDDDEKVFISSECEDDTLVQYTDSLYRAALTIAEKYGNGDSDEISEKLESAKTKYKEQIEGFETIIKEIIGEQPTKYIDLNANLEFDDETTSRFVVNSKGEIVYYDVNDQEEYDKHGKCKLLSETIELCHVSSLQGILYNMSSDFDKEVELPLIY